MSIKLVILKSGDTLIADAKELIVGEEDNSKIVGYLLNHPYKISHQKSLLLTEEMESNDSMVEITMSPWILLTSDTSVLQEIGRSDGRRNFGKLTAESRHCGLF